SIVLQIARAYTPAPIARHQRSSTQLTSLLINNAGALGPAAPVSVQRTGMPERRKPPVSRRRGPRFRPS
ncbi:hypothetical protein, partial [Mycobacterium ulcerans]